MKQALPDDLSLISIHPSSTLLIWLGCRKPEVYCKRLRAQGCQSITGHEHTLSQTYSHITKILEMTLQPTTNVFGLVEKTAVPRGNPLSMMRTWTPYKYGEGRVQTPQPWRCEVNILTTKTPCTLLWFLFSYLFFVPLSFSSHIAFCSARHFF